MENSVHDLEKYYQLESSFQSLRTIVRKIRYKQKSTPSEADMDVFNNIEDIIQCMYFDVNFIYKMEVPQRQELLMAIKNCISYLWNIDKYDTITSNLLTANNTLDERGWNLKNIKEVISKKLIDNMATINKLYKENNTLAKESRVDFIREYIALVLDYIYGDNHTCSFDMKHRFESELLDFIMNCENEHKLKQVFAEINTFFSRVESNFVNNHAQLNYIKNIITLSS